MSSQALRRSELWGEGSSSQDQVRSRVRGCDGRGWADAVAGACTRSVLSTAQGEAGSAGEGQDGEEPAELCGGTLPKARCSADVNTSGITSGISTVGER